MTLRRLASPVAVLALSVSLALAGCGGGHASPRGRAAAPVVKAPAPFVCHPRFPPQAGECIAQELRARSVAPVAPKLGATFGGASRAQGIDISRWQPHPSFRTLRAEGIRFVIIQTNAGGCACNPFFYGQVREATAAGLKVGVYVFVEPSSSTTQADLLARVVAPVRSKITAGEWIDTEVSGSYERACPIAERLRSVWHFKIIGDYGSTGTVPSWLNRCNLLDWPASWGSGAPHPALGFSFASMKVRQWCGTCVLGGNSGQIDRDEDLGLLALVAPPKPPTHAQVLARWHRELGGHYLLRKELWALIARHHCKVGEHAVPRSYHTVCGYWLRHLRIEQSEIKKFHHKHVF